MIYRSRLIPALLLMLVPALTKAQVTDKQVTIDGLAPYDGAKVRAAREERHARELQAYYLLEDAKAAIKKGEASNALTLLQRALSFDPLDGEIRLRLTYFYIQKGQPQNVIATLGRIVNPPDNISFSVGHEITVQMIYTLALLDCNAWPEAVACYQKSRQNPRPRWFIDGGGPDRVLPNPSFSVDAPDQLGLRAYAHLVLGTHSPAFMEEKDQIPFMLEHLQQLLQINPRSFDAAFASGCLYRKLGRYEVAQSAHAYASQLASPSERKEINAELKELKADEESHKRYLAQQAAMQVKAK